MGKDEVMSLHCASDCWLSWTNRKVTAWQVTSNATVNSEEMNCISLT
ncbi:hypothetical protein COLO4_10249 [Corchorus olitorius]|uniref:Uncharacterized protein n=1 Tax=Corchorus olitorius TaxID=93759 RepID=A0A1R3K9G4_9ROSI|nr:hypothetical protein COLO4_10249 [Corchorus olitorius]